MVTQHGLIPRYFVGGPLDIVAGPLVGEIPKGETQGNLIGAPERGAVGGDAIEKDIPGQPSGVPVD